MNFLNKHSLPAPFVRAAMNDPYDRGGADHSPSSLSIPPRAHALITSFPDDITVDVSNMVASIIGQGAHKIAERAARPGDISEKRFFRDILVNGKKYSISAQIDLWEHDSKEIWDWKTTKAYAFSKKAGGGKKPEWIAQLNIQKWIMRGQVEPIDVKGLNIIALLKDWEERKAGADHPETEVVAVPIDMWEDLKVECYIRAKIEAFEQAMDALPQCKSGDHWQGRRCARWCDASSVCTQYKEMAKTGLIV